MFPFFPRAYVAGPFSPLRFSPGRLFSPPADQYFLNNVPKVIFCREVSNSLSCLPFFPKTVEASLPNWYGRDKTLVSYNQFVVAFLLCGPLFPSPRVVELFPVGLGQHIFFSVNPGLQKVLRWPNESVSSFLARNFFAK